MITVYRFENSEGLGPWTGGAAYTYDQNQRTRDKWHTCYNLPAPSDHTEGRVFDHWNDGSLGHFIFGFTSLRQLRKAFRSGVGREAMAREHGQMLNVYLVSPEAVFSSRSQAIFLPTYAMKVGSLDPRTLKPIPPKE